LPKQCHDTLSRHNPAYRELRITQLPSWVRKPDSYGPNSVSSLAFAFEDPDGQKLRSFLNAGPFYAFGTVVKAAR
jgi:hypothetical protein